MPPIHDPRFRGLAAQALLLGAVATLVYAAATNAIESLERQRIASGFGFLENTSGFDISQALIPYGATSTYGRAFWVGLLNTLLVAMLGIVAATVLGFLIGIARLSTNWLVASIAGAYVELVRNLPLLLQLLFWYNAVLTPLPAPRESINLGGAAFLNNRGLFLPKPVFDEREWIVALAFGVGLAAAVGFGVWARRRRDVSGRRVPVAPVAALLTIGVPAVCWLVLTFTGGNPIRLDFPEQQRFNLRGGLQVLPEFVALLVGLSTYTAAFIAEIVRAGVLAVSRGQTEAAHALGLRPGPTLRLVVVPQALRVIIPPLTSQYLNLAKNSSLAVAIGYPDLVQVFAGTVLNQTGQALEVIAMTMAVYLVISLATSALMNAYNRRVAIVER